MADLSGRITISRAEHADLLRRAGDREDRETAARLVAERDAAIAKVADADRLVQSHIDELRAQAWEHAAARFTGPPSWTSAEACLAMLVAELVATKERAERAEVTLANLKSTLRASHVELGEILGAGEGSHYESADDAARRVVCERDEAQAALERAQKTYPLQLENQLAAIRDATEAYAGRAGLLGTPLVDVVAHLAAWESSHVGRSSGFYELEIERLRAQLLVADRERDALGESIEKALGDRCTGNLAADVGALMREAHNARMSLDAAARERDETIACLAIARAASDAAASDVREARHVARELLTDLLTGTSRAIQMGRMAVATWDAAPNLSPPVVPAPWVPKVGDRVRIVRGAIPYTVGIIGTLDDIDEGCAEGCPYYVRADDGSLRSGVSWWAREIEPAPASIADAVRDAVHTAVREGGAYAVRDEAGTARAWVSKPTTPLDDDGRCAARASAGERCGLDVGHEGLHRARDGGLSFSTPFTRVGDEDDGAPA